jgi:hypothetical protein
MEALMGDDSDLREERKSILKWLFDASFGRLVATAHEIGRAIFLLGSINRRLEDR